jgi:iron complex outermembrane receptor protein
VELGTKASLIQNRLGVSLTLFQIDKKDPYGFVYLDPENPNFDEYNVYYDGKHRSKGIELDIDGKATPWLSITAGAAFTDTEVVEDPGYPKGNRLPNAPRYTGNFWINYEPTGTLKGLTLGTGYFYKSKFFSGIDNNPDLQVDNSFTVDLAAGYEFKRFGAQVNVTNITNERNYLNPWVFNLFDIQPLRRVVLTLRYRFGAMPR